MVWLNTFMWNITTEKRNYSSLRNEQKFYISLELDIFCPESDSRKLVLGSLVKKIFQTEYIP